MLKTAQVRGQRVLCVQIKATGNLRKQHSNLYTYAEDDQYALEFVANFGTPAVNGYIVQVEGDAPIYLNEAEFNQKYLIVEG